MSDASPLATSRWRTFSQILAVILGVELLIMLVLQYLPHMPWMLETAIDAGTLTLVGAPIIWRIVARPLRQAMNAERFRAQAEMSAVLVASADATIVTDEQGRVRLFNRGAEEMFGYTAAEMAGRSIGELMPEEQRAVHEQHVKRFNASGEVARPMSERNRLMGRRKGGALFPAEISIARTVTPSGATLVATVRDVTNRQRAEHELQRAKEQAESGARAKSEFLANMSHEIRTPMNAVIGLTGLLLDTPLNDEQRDFVETVRASGDQLLAIINDILDYSKIESGKLELERHRFDVREAVETALDLVAHRAAEKRLDLLYLVEDDVPTAVLGDVTRLRQIIVNLVGNAVKFTDQGEVFVHGTARRLDAGRIELRFDVRDTGIGIPADRMDRLFRSFSQIDTSTTRQYGGTGLGLAISKRLAEMMGGRLWVESELGKGATFSFTVEADEAAAEVRSVRGGVKHLNGRRILVVDDNATNRLILERQLSQMGAAVRLAASQRTALGTVGAEPPFDAMLLDARMPEADGVATARAIHAQLGAGTPPLVLLSSGSDHPPPGLFAATLAKPVKPGHLVRVLDGIFGIRPAAERGPAPSALDTELASKHPLRILLAEDNPVNQKVAERILDRMGYRVDIVGNGLEALDAVDRLWYDVVFMDVQMPEMDGLEATRQIRELPTRSGARPRIIAMTAGALDTDRAAAEEAGMDDFVSKPVRVEELQEAIVRASAAIRTAKRALSPEE